MWARPLKNFSYMKGVSYETCSVMLQAVSIVLHSSFAKALPWLVHNHMKRHISLLFLFKRPACRGLKRSQSLSRRGEADEWERDKVRKADKWEKAEGKKKRTGQRVCLPRCFLQFLYIPAALWGINLSISPNTRANTPTHLTHAFTALISHSIAHRLTDTLKADWLTVWSDTSDVPAVTVCANVATPA